MGFVNLKNKRKVPNRNQILKARPVRSERLQFAEEEDGRVILSIPVEIRGRAVRWLSKVGRWPSVKEVELEPVGAFVWKHCDGKHTCEGIARLLSGEYKLSKVEAEASLVSFLETLLKRQYIRLELTSK
ncbi:MAG: hypothetical protein AKCLJLPJ_00877 [Fimbriimonadales bacterium]|nr:PqqD family protein [Armatimonadota bacterium]MBV6502823.1 hypothetical protein [Fimbriimonadales bacterium]